MMPCPAPTSVPEKYTATSAEGYITKRGHVRKSWKRRYLVLDGATLQVRYYESKDVSKTDPGSTKGSFVLTSVKKEDFEGIFPESKSVFKMFGHASRGTPHGFIMTGHTPGKGKVLLEAVTSSKVEADRWVEIANNALQASKANYLENSSGEKRQLGRTASDSDAMTMKATKSEFLKDALKDLESAKSVGREACNEIAIQGEKLDNIEARLESMHADLDYGDRILQHMQRPLLHLLSKSGRPTAKAHSSRKNKMIGPASMPDLFGSGMWRGGSSDSDGDLHKIAMALTELEEQAAAINVEATKTTMQVGTIAEQLRKVDSRVQGQTKAAKKQIGSANLF